MRHALPYGHHHLELEIADADLVSVRRPLPAPPLDDPAAAVAAALEQPVDYPPLRRALTPDDHVVIVVDERLRDPARLLVPILEHLAAAQIQPAAITLLCQTPSTGQPWLEDLPEAFQDVQVELHQPGDRRHLSYLATTKGGRRIYINRTAVDADQLVVLTGRRFDPRLGIGGAEGDLFPALSDQATLEEVYPQLSMEAPDAEPWPLRREAREVTWLLGAPFFVQVIEGGDDAIVQVIGGPVAASDVGQKILEARWRLDVDEPADVVLAGIGGDPERHTAADLARAFACAARVVRPGGQVVVLSDALPALGDSLALVQQQEDPGAARQLLLQEKPPDLETGFLWASAAVQARLYLLSRLPVETVEELFAIPLQNAAQVAKLVVPGRRCLVIPDAHRTLAAVKET